VDSFKRDKITIGDKFGEGGMKVSMERFSKGHASVKVDGIT